MPYSLSKQHYLPFPLLGFIGTGVYKNIPKSSIYNPKSLKSTQATGPILTNETNNRLHNTSDSIINRSNNSIPEYCNGATKISFYHNQAAANQNCQDFTEVITPQINIKSCREDILIQNGPEQFKTKILANLCQSSCFHSMVSNLAMLVSEALELKEKLAHALGLGPRPTIPIKRRTTDLIDLPVTEVSLNLETRSEAENNNLLQASNISLTSVTGIQVIHANPCLSKF